MVSIPNNLLRPTYKIGAIMSTAIGEYDAQIAKEPNRLYAIRAFRRYGERGDTGAFGGHDVPLILCDTKNRQTLVEFYW